MMVDGRMATSMEMDTLSIVTEPKEMANGMMEKGSNGLVPSMLREWMISLTISNSIEGAEISQ